MKKSYETLLERIREYIYSTSEPADASQIRDWYIGEYGVRTTPTSGTISSLLRMHGRKVGISGFKPSKSDVYLWRREEIELREESKK
tara:strand:+ start:1566 stop:1826 length:261 start_codon:yes stop_codon:yes gene_type:complete